MVFVFVMVVVIVWFILYCMVFGCYFFVVGKNEVVVCYVGIDIRRVIVMVYVFCIFFIVVLVVFFVMYMCLV